MRNKYAGTCYRCGKIVDVGEGHFERIPYGGWRVQHADCAIEWRGQPDDITKLRNKTHKKGRKRTDDVIAQGTGKSAQRARRRLREREESIRESKGIEFEAMKAKTLLRIKEFGFLSDTFTDEQKVASEIASMFPVGKDKLP